ncbi:hypothetical protein HDU93_000749 [Gonapodya sp. JEL0774]|nr:hypothetical protein HDU93_000749 [Gonapodya sp. JEL0774]
MAPARSSRAAGSVPVFLRGFEGLPSVKIIGNSLLGFGFGIALQKGKLFEPLVIQGQFLAQDWRMMQSFLAASGTTMLLAALSSVPECHADEGIHELVCAPVNRMKSAREKNTGGKPRGLAAVIVGASILGGGMALAGACPGVLYPQIGSASPSAPYALMGAVAGVLTYSVLEPTFKRTLNKWWQPTHSTIDQIVGASYASLAIPTSLAMLSAAAAISLFLPHSHLHTTASTIFGMVEWHPLIAGVAIGLLQVPSVTILHAPLGASSALVAVASPLAPLLKYLGILDEDTELAKWRFPSWDALGKISFAIAAILGGYASSSTSGTFATGSGLAAAPLVIATIGWKAQAVIGGWMLLFGARVAGGCTSGHGISGFGFLGVTSVAAVAAMFGGGFGMAAVLKCLI